MNLLVDSKSAELTKPMRTIVAKTYSQDVLDNTIVERITYLSEGLKINGYIARPSEPGRYPVLLWNRGGFGDRGALDDLRAYLILASTALWGYVVLATQYRGNMGSEGEEDWGGRDVYDALNLLKVGEQLDYCDMSRVAIEGASRGGMTTYRAITMDDRFRCGMVHAGVSDLYTLADRQGGFAETLEEMFGDLPPNEKERQLAQRSAVYFADRFPDNVPLLLMHGTDDRRVPISQTEDLAAELKRLGKPFEFVRIEGGGHVALKDGSYREVDRHRKQWLERYMKQGS